MSDTNNKKYYYSDGEKVFPFDIEEHDQELLDEYIEYCEDHMHSTPDGCGVEFDHWLDELAKRFLKENKHE